MTYTEAQKRANDKWNKNNKERYAELIKLIFRRYYNNVEMKKSEFNKP
jgi:hypothetical protein